MIEFNCTSCGKPISATQEQVGQQCSCPYCSAVQVVPHPAGPGAPPPLAAAGMPQAPGPYAGGPERPEGSGMAIAAFVLGLCSLLFGALTAIPAIILAIISVAKGGRGKGLAIAGFFCAVVLGAANFSLIFYGLTRAKGMAKKVACQTNVRTIGLAVTQYHMEYNDWMPKARAFTEDGHTTYAGEISLYLACEDDPWLSSDYWKPGAPAALTCPSERKDFGENILAYGWNWSYLGTDRQAEGAWWIRRKTSEVWRPEETSCLGESRPMDKGQTTGFNPLTTTIYWGGRCPRVNPPDNYYMARRHNDGANYSCVDGHVEYAEYDDLVDDWLGDQRVFSRGE